MFHVFFLRKGVGRGVWSYVIGSEFNTAYRAQLESPCCYSELCKGKIFTKYFAELGIETRTSQSTEVLVPSTIKAIVIITLNITSTRILIYGTAILNVKLGFN